jgi:hypothetical protein
MKSSFDAYLGQQLKKPKVRAAFEKERKFFEHRVCIGEPAKEERANAGGGRKRRSSAAPHK